MPAPTTPASEREIRFARLPLVDLEWRDAGQTGDGSFTLLGHAAVTGEMTTLYAGKYWTLREQIAPGAFKTVLASRPDVHLNLNHDMSRAIARTGVNGVGGMELSEDDRGLRVFARLDSEDPDVQALAAKMKRGIVDQMSFAFRVGSDEVLIETDAAGHETETRTILEVSDLYDCAVCAQGAYPQTDVSLRGLAAILGRAGIDPAGLKPYRASAGAENITIAPADDPAGGDDMARKHKRLKRHCLIASLRI